MLQYAGGTRARSYFISVTLKSWSGWKLLDPTAYLGSMLTNDGRCTCEIKSRIAMAKAAFSNNKTLFCQ